MSFLQKLNPMYWVDMAKEKFVMGTVTKFLGSTLRTWAAIGIGLLGGLGVEVEPEAVEKIQAAVDPIVTIIVGGVSIWVMSLFEKFKK